MLYQQHSSGIPGRIPEKIHSLSQKSIPERFLEVPLNYYRRKPLTQITQVCIFCMESSKDSCKLLWLFTGFPKRKTVAMPWVTPREVPGQNLVVVHEGIHWGIFSWTSWEFNWRILEAFTVWIIGGIIKQFM